MEWRCCLKKVYEETDGTCQEMAKRLDKEELSKESRLMCYKYLLPTLDSSGKPRKFDIALIS